MSGYVKMGLLIGGAIIIATAMWIYFSPLQTCIRAQVALCLASPTLPMCQGPSGMRDRAVLNCSSSH